MHSPTDSIHHTLLAVHDLGVMPYAEAYNRQLSVHGAVLAGEAPPTLLLVEHPPVITLSQRPGARQHLLADDARLAELGIEVCQTNRGGDITYHGPGQLVAYPIFRLGMFKLNVSTYMRLLERVVVEVVRTFGVQAKTVEGCTGVWVDRNAQPGGKNNEQSSCTDSAKLAAMGIRIRRGVTLHGLALNVTTDLSHFETIVPCGLANRAVTSLADVLGPHCPTMPQVKSAITRELQASLAHGLGSA